MKTLDPWPKEKRRANFKMIEQDLYTYKLMKKQLRDVLEEVDEMLEPRAVANYGFYTLAARPAKGRDIIGEYLSEYIHARKQPSVSNPTAEKAQLLSEYKRNLLGGLEFREMVRHLEAVEFVLNGLDSSEHPEARRKLSLVEEKYFKRQLTDEGIVVKLNISLRTFYYWKKEVVEAIAARLGVVV